MSDPEPCMYCSIVPLYKDTSAWFYRHGQCDLCRRTEGLGCTYSSGYGEIYVCDVCSFGPHLPTTPPVYECANGFHLRRDTDEVDRLRSLTKGAHKK